MNKTIKNKKELLDIASGLDKFIKSIENKKKNNSSMITLQKKDVSKIAPDIEDKLKSSLAESLDVKSIENK